MEVRIEVESKDPGTGSFYPLIISTFTMVATFEGKARRASVVATDLGLFHSSEPTTGCPGESTDPADPTRKGVISTWRK